MPSFSFLKKVFIHIIGFWYYVFGGDCVMMGMNDSVQSIMQRYEELSKKSPDELTDVEIALLNGLRRMIRQRLARAANVYFRQRG